MSKNWFYFFLFLLLVTIIPTGGFPFEVEGWKKWALYIFRNGLSNAYRSGTDYMPLLQYILFFFDRISGTEKSIIEHLYLLKIISLTFDFIGGFYILKLCKFKFSNSRILFYYSLFYFLNPAIYFNSLVWFQFDGILSSLVFISVYHAINKNISISLIALLLAINFKLQAIIFIPIVGIILLPELLIQFSLKSLISWLGPILAIQFIILIPFIQAGQLTTIISVVEHSFNKFPFVSMNAAGIWNWLVFNEPTKVSDQISFFGIAYKTWGLLLFMISAFIAIWPLLKTTFLKIFRETTNQISISDLMLICSLFVLSFFFFNTQMHERYSHPALLFVISYSIISKDLFPTFLLSFAYLINLEVVIHALGFPNYGIFILSRSLIAIFYFILIAYLFYRLYFSRIRV